MYGDLDAKLVFRPGNGQPASYRSSVGLVSIKALVLPNRSSDRPAESSRSRRLSHQQTYASYCARPERCPIERLFAWLQNFRRLVVRYEHHAENFLGMLDLACCLILLRHL